jgi:hypothetical protein
MRAPIATFRAGAFAFGVGEGIVVFRPDELGVSGKLADVGESTSGFSGNREGGRFGVLRPAVVAESVA